MQSFNIQNDRYRSDESLCKSNFYLTGHDNYEPVLHNTVCMTHTTTLMIKVNPYAPL